MEDYKPNAGQNLGVASLIIGIITFVLAIIPCVGLIAIIPGIVTIVLAAVGLSQATRNDSPKGLMVAGLIIGILAIMISFSQVFIAGKLIRDSDKWPSEIKSAIEEVKDDLEKEFNDAKVSIKIETNGEKVEINASSEGKENKVKQLEDLEGESEVKGDTLKPVK